jgi:hypothetical protein
MKVLAALSLTAVPVSAYAGQWPHAYSHAAMHSGHIFVVLYAVLAVLGYWVTQHSVKETAVCVKRTGAVVGMALVVVGLLGMLCALLAHVRHSAWRCHAHEQPVMAQPQVTPDLPGQKTGPG